MNVFTMGHATYQLALERAFARHAPDMSFESVHLSAHYRKDFVGRAAWFVLGRRLFGAGANDRDYLRLRAELAQSLFMHRFLKRRLRRGSPDVVHVHTQSIALLSARLFRSVPTVLSMDCTSALLARLHPAPADRTYRPIVSLERAAFKSAAHLVCWSDIVRRSVIDDYGIPAEKVTVIRPTVPAAFFVERAARRPGRALRLLFVGNDFRRKGGEDVLAVVREHFTGHCELDIVSNGCVPDVDLPSVRVHRGIAPLSPALMTLYRAADVFVMPTHEDALGLVYLEAMATGLPCIGTRTLAVPELVRHGVTGLCVDAGNRVALAEAIQRFRDEPALAKTLGAAGRDFVRRECDEATNSSRLRAIFEGAARGPVRARGVAAGCGD